MPASVVPHIAQRLRSTGYHALSAVKCEYHEGVVVLHGRVSSYYMKQVAQAVLMADPLIEDIVNLIEVSGVNHAA
ncbi:MAG: hypothetical protein JXM70_10155 [Pirellulales bacterium]|nr:hypothetical protein [Pirellulales bacterium]